MKITTNATPVLSPTQPGALARFRRPRLLPGLQVLHRGHGEVQVGTDPRHAVVLLDVPLPLARLLHTLDGRDTAAELTARAGPIEPGTLDRVLTELARFGLLEDAARAEAGAAVPPRLAADCSWWALRTAQERVSANIRRMRSAVLIHGGGRVAVSLATLLAAAGVGWVSTVSEGTVQPEDVGCGYLEEDVGKRRSLAIRKAIVRTAPATNTSPLPSTRKPDLVLLADAVVPDPYLVRQLFADGSTHLVAWAGEGVGVIGPLVVPRRSACLHCVDLHKTATEPAWPALATQLAGRAQPADLASAQASAAFAVSQALRVLDGPRRGDKSDPVDPTGLPVWSATVEIDTFNGETRRTNWS
ncbi:MAG TPA: thiamine biosynthesis protein ThiF, partial [Pseudonocardiaceae bacterium]|nr:thiamine biosynthesis protein ThiF [Pseudonocardiaceae bacterium]